MDKCTQMQELISRMLDEELGEEERSVLAEHLKECGECRRTYEAFAAVSGALREDLAEAPEALHENVMAELRRERMLRRNRRSWRTALTAAAAILLLAVGLRAVGGLGSPAQHSSLAREEESAAGTGLQDDMDAAQTEGAAEEEAAEPEEAAEAPAEVAAAAPKAEQAQFDEEESDEAFGNGSAGYAAAAESRPADGGAGEDAAARQIDLSRRMDMAQLLRFLNGETVRQAPDRIGRGPSCLLLVSDGTLAMYEQGGELYYFEPGSGKPMRTALRMEEIAAAAKD